MGVLNNIQRFKTFDIREYIKNFQRQIQTGLKLDAIIQYNTISLLVCPNRDFQY